MILDPNGMPILQPTVDNAETATFNDAFAAIGNALAEVTPAGNVSATARTSAPAGWLLCDGSAVSRTTYEVLFTAISTTYGAGDGTTTFNLPDMRGRAPVGRDSGQTEFDVLGETGGAKTNTHNHFTLASNDGNNYRAAETGRAPRTRVVSFLRATVVSSLTNTTAGLREDSTHDETIATLPPYSVLNFIIKA